MHHLGQPTLLDHKATGARAQRPHQRQRGVGVGVGVGVGQYQQGHGGQRRRDAPDKVDAGIAEAVDIDQHQPRPVLADQPERFPHAVHFQYFTGAQLSAEFSGQRGVELGRFVDDQREMQFEAP